MVLHTFTDPKNHTNFQFDNNHNNKNSTLNRTFAFLIEPFSIYLIFSIWIPHKISHIVCKGRKQFWMIVSHKKSSASSKNQLEIRKYWKKKRITTWNGIIDFYRFSPVVFFFSLTLVNIIMHDSYGSTCRFGRLKHRVSAFNVAKRYRSYSLSCFVWPNWTCKITWQHHKSNVFCEVAT